MRPFLALLLLFSAACTTLPVEPDANRPGAAGPDGRAPAATVSRASTDWTPPALDPARVRVTPESATVEDHWLPHVYAFLKGTHHRGYRVEFPAADGAGGVAHWLLPEGPGPHPAVLVFPVRGGEHLVSEMVAKSLVNRGYAVLRIERKRIFPGEDEPPGDFLGPLTRLRALLLDSRRLLGWLETRPEIDPTRLATAGVSLGGIMAATLMGIDDRVRGGVFIMAGGGLAEILHDSKERPLERFRERAYAELGIATRQSFLDEVRPLTEAIDPLTYADRLDPRRVLLVSGRFDRAVPPERTEALWEALGRPTWHRYPGGHKQLVPFFWWAMGEGADLLDEVLASPVARDRVLGGGVDRTGRIVPGQQEQQVLDPANHARSGFGAQ